MEAMVFIWLLLRCVGPIYCGMRADSLNRTPWVWAVLGFLFPIISIISISALSPVTKWSQEK